MRTNIIEDLRSYYVDQNVKIDKLLGNKQLKQICDAYFKEGLSYAAISKRYAMTVKQVHNLMIRACGLIIRNRHKRETYE